MEIRDLLSKPVWQMTGEEFIFLNRHALQEAYASVGVTLGDNKVVKLITMLKSKRMIVQENGRKYTFNPDFHY